ncbi:MAG: hypothetical protein EU539_05940 [Promethearchaeota archaeon]|nr:MAG: hypothetical protein EU539_05940 [Candidatus Lokiarchaeota archaeon]
MLFQEINDKVLEAMAIASVISAFIVFIPGLLITLLWAKKKDWEGGIKPALILNVVWLIVNVIIGWFSFLVIALVINIIIGGFLASKLYDKELGESFSFCLVVFIIIFVIWIILVLIIGFILAAPHLEESTEEVPIGEDPYG